jgi:hypothetical protein
MSNPTDQDLTGNASKSFADPNRHLVEVPDSFAIARWPRDGDEATIARCILGTLKYEPHAVDTTVLRRALEGVIEHTARGGRDFCNSEGNTTMTDKKDVPQTARDVPTVEVTMEYLSALRKAVGLQIDPETAEVEWIYAHTLDPYGDDPDLPEELQCVGREYFARSPGSNVGLL